MRPKLLEVEGLQSFQDCQKIDFETLSETGLFGIFGPTGSGKSTILDAITFALYGKVKRAERGTQGIINANRTNARVSFTFELLKDGHHKTYRVDRNYQRKKGTENSCEPKVVRLVEITAGGELPLCDKATEVTGSIEDLLGLNHEDFTRAVVLPQNSFHELLMLENSKKREMLERIFYLEAYGKQLTDKLWRKMSLMKSRMDVLSGELLSFADATEEELQNQQQQLENAIDERRKIEQESKALEKQYSQSREVWQQVQELARIEEKEKEHAIRKADIDEKRIALDNAVRADSLLEKIQKNKTLEEKLTETTVELNAALERYPLVNTQLQTLQHDYETYKAEAAVEQPKWVSLKTRLIDLLVEQTEVTALEQQIFVLQNTSEKYNQDIANREQRLTQQKHELQLLTQSIADLQKNLTSLSVDPEYRQQLQEGVKLEHDLDTVNASAKEQAERAAMLKETIQALRQKQKHAVEKIQMLEDSLNKAETEAKDHEVRMPDKMRAFALKDEIHALVQTAEILKIRGVELEHVNTRINGLQTSCMQIGRLKDKLLQQFDRERDAYALCRADTEKATKELEKHTAYMLSQRLQHGEPCPVCGSMEHPAPALTADHVDVLILEKQLETNREKHLAAESAYRETEAQLLKVEAQLQGENTQLEQLAKEQASKQAQLNSERNRLPLAYRDFDTALLQQQIEMMHQAYDESQNVVEAWEKKRDQLAQSIKTIQEALGKGRPFESSIATELQMKEADLLQLKLILEQSHAKQHDKRSEYNAFLEELKIQGAALEMARLAENDKQAAIFNKKLEQHQVLFEQMRSQIDKLNDEIQNNKAALLKNETELDNLTQAKQQKVLKIQQLVGNRTITDEIERVEIQLSQLQQTEVMLKEKLQQAQKQYHDLTAQMATLTKQHQIYQESFRHDEEALEALLLEKGFATRDTVEQVFLPQDKQMALQQEIKAYEQKALNIRAEREMVQKRLNSRTITQEEWDMLDGRYQQILAYKEACVTQSEVVRAGFEQLKIRHEKWRQLEADNTALSNKYGLYQQIQKLLRADKNKDNSFIDFIAEERLRYVAAKASDILGVMTKYKYALELDANSGFIIRDNANGGILRMVTTLSGGETFLTALSLALSLSEQIQLKGQSPLEFFFLDEGFGTLDNSLLDTVIDSLERLSNRERVIGVISHVPELRNRISRRLIVSPPTAQGDGSRVKIEKA